MKKGLRFQTRLMLAFLFATSLVSFAVIQLTGEKVKQTYERQFKEKFDGEVHYLFEAREKRSEAQFVLGKKLAASEFVVRQLLDNKEENEPSEARREFLASLPPIPSANSQGAFQGKRSESVEAAQKLNRILAVMNLEGEIFYLTAPQEKKTARKRTVPGKMSIQKQLEVLKQNDAQKIAYFPQKLPNGEIIIRDLSVTPVKNPANGELIGAFLMSLTTAETGAERFLDRYHKEVNEAHFENAILIDDVLYPSGALGAVQKHARNEDVNFAKLEAMTVHEISHLPGGKFDGNFECKIHGEPHYVHYCALNPDSLLSTAWQISAFPMTELKKDLNDLRIKGSGIGLIGILIGLVTAWFLSRNLSIPIRELSEGTRKIREGELNTELTVRSHDEIGELTESFNKMAAELRQKEMYRRLLGKVSDESVAQAMIEGSLNPELGGEIKQVSILFCDIRGFTNLTESMPPEEIIEILNQHMTVMTRIVREHFGVVDKFIGDEIMAVFGGLKSYGNDAANAARCAIKMIEERDRLNHANGTDIQIGIGVATGEIVAGCMGSEDRLNYTVLGARVNLGSRLCSLAAGGEIVIDDQTFEQIADLNPVTQLIEGLFLKGFSATVPAWKLTGTGVNREILAAAI